MAQHVVVREYDGGAKQRYEAAREALEGALGQNLAAIWHIGSTAVEGLAAKPIVDIMAAVKSLDEVDGLAGKLCGMGYEYLGEFGIAGRRYLRKGGDERTEQVHIFRADDTYNIVRHLAFRQYMRTHADEREEYARLKRELASKYPYDIEGYCDGKDEYVGRVEKLALAEYDDSWDRLYLAARRVQGARALSPLVEAGSVAAALMTDSGRIYAGVCIDTACSLGMCAERNAIANMITNGENKICKLVAVMPDGRAGMPCGACREMLMQLGCGDAQILCNYYEGGVVRLKDLVPDWWQ